MDNIVERIVELRELGYSFRAIERLTGIPKSTAHKYYWKAIKAKKDIVFTTMPFSAGFYVHFPFYFICPNCGKKQNHAWLCRCCGKFIPAECDYDGCFREGFDLSKVRRIY